MTIEKWAKDFKSYVYKLQLFQDDYKGIIEYIDEGLAMLKKQEPIQVVWEFAFPHCPECGQMLPEGDRVKYCFHCGQAVKWDV